MYDLKILGVVVLVISTCFLFAAIWLAGVLLKEANDIKQSATNVKSAFSSVNVEITNKLKNNNAIAYADIAKIVKKVANLFPGVNITLKKEFEIKQVTIVIESGDFTANYTILATIVEYGYRPGSKETSDA